LHLKKNQTLKNKMKKYNNEFIDSFLYEKKFNEGLKTTSIKSYCSMFNSLIEDINIDVYNLETFTELNIKYFLWEKSQEKKWTSYTYNRYVKLLKVFCEYLKNEHHILKNPVEKIKLKKIDKALPKSFNKIDVKKIKNACDSLFNKKENFLHLRNKTIFNMFLYTWLRLNELLSLKIQDINFLDWILKVNKWKGWKDRIVPLSNEILDIFIEYLLFRKKQYFNSEYFFPSKSGLKVQHRDIYLIFKKVQERSLLKITPHMLRHTYATELVRKNINLYNISRVLWHSDLKTTKIYLSTNVDNIKDSINASNLYH